MEYRTFHLYVASANPTCSVVTKSYYSLTAHQQRTRKAVWQLETSSSQERCPLHQVLSKNSCNLVNCFGSSQPDPNKVFCHQTATIGICLDLLVNRA